MDDFALIQKLGLPPVKGRYSFNRPLASYAWFNVGGPADVIFRPLDEDDLAYFLQHYKGNLPILPLGVGSNLLIRDGGVRGIIIRLGRGFNFVDNKDDLLIAGAGTLDKNVAYEAAAKGIANTAFLATIPGTIGGAVRMNAGCYGTEIKDALAWVEALDRNGIRHRFTVEECNFTYRHCALPNDLIFTKAAFHIVDDDPEKIMATIHENEQQREATQPTKGKTGGSTFKNPLPHRAWELVDSVNGRGLTIGGAQVSEKHCNFLINTGTATAKDIETLGNTLVQRVQASHNINLEWEIKIIGEAQS